MKSKTEKNLIYLLIACIVTFLSYCILFNHYFIIFNKTETVQPIGFCFTPSQNCEYTIVRHINDAKNSILVQAYRITNKKIQDALAISAKRGVHVILIIDKAAKKDVQTLKIPGITLYIDYKPRIAHNKIMIFDSSLIITGSYNFTENAQKYNAENLVEIRDPAVVAAFVRNFNTRLQVSRSY